MGCILTPIGGEVTSSRVLQYPIIMGEGWRTSGDTPTHMCQPAITIITLPGEVAFIQLLIWIIYT